MPAVEIDASLIRALQTRARKEGSTVERLVKRLIASAARARRLQAMKEFRARAARGAEKPRRT
jgi:hypothetical protein